MALDADELQYERGYGPCVDAGNAAQTLLIDNIQTDKRWARLRPARRRARSAQLAVGAATVPRRNRRCAQHLCHTAKGFDDQDLDLAEEVAAWVAVAIGNAEAATRSSEDLTQLRIVMMSRAHIERAKGILMERHKITDDEAFTMLTRASQRTNTKLHDVAAELVRTGTCLFELDALGLGTTRRGDKQLTRLANPGRSRAGGE